MRIIIVGSGAREVVIAKKLFTDNSAILIHNISTFINPEMNILCEKIFVVEKYDLENIVDFIDLDYCYNYVIIGPESALEQAYADFFDELKIPCFGPGFDISQLETSKKYCRDFLQKNGLGHLCPMYTCLHKNSYIEVNNLLTNFLSNEMEIVIKRDGLCGGKGVIVQGVDFENTSEVIDSLINSEEKILIEEKLVGNEFSFFSICDGNKGIKHFPPIMDFKRLNNNNKGPNTGGMGCLIDKNNTLPFLNDNDIEYVKYINGKIYEKNPEYVGILYGSYMKCSNNKIKLIEINCRFGDPECIIALELLKTNFSDLMNATLQGKLSEFPDLQFYQDAMVCVYLVPIGYPNIKKSNNFDIFFTNKKLLSSNKIIFSNVIFDNDHLFTDKSRSIVVWEKAQSILECRNNVYNNIKSIVGSMYYRTDIGANFVNSNKYSEAGVDVNKAEQALSFMKNDILSTYNDNVLSDYGSFSGEYKLGDHILLASIDGVGTKSILVKKFKGTEGFISLGYDIVNHSINDILVQGGKPLLFLNYFGTDNLNIDELTNFVKGISQACKPHNVVLMGGETAEMPTFYKEGNTELIGSILGVKEITVDHRKIDANDILLYYDSSGPHTNGYSLIRNIKLTNDDVHNYPELLAPHRCYYKEITDLIKTYGPDFIKGMCHITGGGLFGNLKRIIPEHLFDNLYIDLDELTYPDWVLFLKKKLNMNIRELIDVFNCGIGYVIIISEENYEQFKSDINLKYLGKII